MIKDGSPSLNSKKFTKRFVTYRGVVPKTIYQTLYSVPNRVYSSLAMKMILRKQHWSVVTFRLPQVPTGYLRRTEQFVNYQTSKNWGQEVILVGWLEFEAFVTFYVVEYLIIQFTFGFCPID